MDTQRAKEKASVLAARRGMSLFTRGHQVLGVMADGQPRILCGSRVMSEMWPKALSVLMRDRELQAPGTFRLVCPDGLFIADSMSTLLFRWWTGRSEPFHASEEEQVG